MTVLSLTLLQPKPGTTWEDFHKELKKGMGLIRKHGGENVTAVANMIGGEDTGKLGVLVSSADWTAHGKTMDAFWSDPEAVAILSAPDSLIASWQTSVAVTIPD